MAFRSCSKALGEPSRRCRRFRNVLFPAVSGGRRLECERLDQECFRKVSHDQLPVMRQQRAAEGLHGTAHVDFHRAGRNPERRRRVGV